MKKKIGRNEPCPCGSGKKFKKCCESKMIGKKYMAHKIEVTNQTSNKISSLTSIIPPSILKPDQNLEKKLNFSTTVEKGSVAEEKKQTTETKPKKEVADTTKKTTEAPKKVAKSQKKDLNKKTSPESS